MVTSTARPVQWRDTPGLELSGSGDRFLSPYSYPAAAIFDEARIAFAFALIWSSSQPSSYHFVPSPSLPPGSFLSASSVTIEPQRYWMFHDTHILCAVLGPRTPSPISMSC